MNSNNNNTTRPTTAESFSRSVLSDLVARLQVLDGGFSVRAVSPREPVAGFMVSPYSARSIGPVPADAVTVDALKGFINANLDLLSREDHYLGGWTDPTTGSSFLDIAVNVDNRDEANRLSVAASQIAFYDLANARSEATQ